MSTLRPRFISAVIARMIYEAYDILKEKGVDPRQIHTEVYFFNGLSSGQYRN
jgi:hypothetical protein